MARRRQSAETGNRENGEAAEVVRGASPTILTPAGGKEHEEKLEKSALVIAGAGHAGRDGPVIGVCG